MDYETERTSVRMISLRMPESACLWGRVATPRNAVGMLLLVQRHTLCAMVFPSEC